MSSVFSKIIERAEEVSEEKEFDAVVIGAGIAGMEASLDLADMGYSVLLIEKEPTIGGKMFLLSKVFPTLDCASCISTPKMAAVAHHPNITLWTYSEVLKIRRDRERGYALRVMKKPRFVDESACTGCYTCEEVCPIDVPKELDFSLRARRAAYIPFDTAVPKIAVIDIDNCIFCGKCERECPVNAINFLQKPKIYSVKAKSIIIATGYNLFQAEKKEQYGFGIIPNVVTSIQMERLLSPTRPFNHVLRPMDGKEPASIGYVLCTGSRDRTVGNPICSQVCCMYSMKQAQLILGALPLADVTVYYMDIRAYGKGFEEFYNQAQAMGVRFIHGRVAKVEKGEGGSVKVKYENIDEGGKLETAEHDLLVLSVGLLPNCEITKVFDGVSLSLDEFGWLLSPDPANPVKTNLEGVFAAGCSTGPKDIPDTVVQAASAAAECAAYLKKVNVIAEER
jgi:heterodisulfide reductase subunit A